MDVQKRLDEIVAAVESARSMPMSASCVVNRAELLGMLQEVRAALPDSLAQAQAVIGDREQVVEEARREAERIVQSAHAERGSLISDTQVARRSQEQADTILSDAKREAAEIKAEADDYVDSKLANFEVVLTKTIAAVDRGREKLLGRGPGMDERGHVDADAPERSSDPDELRRIADDYVDTKLASFEAVLGKTLEAVGRGRQKLLGRKPIDELTQYAHDGQESSPHAGQSDAEYVAALAGQVPAQPGPADPVQQPGYDPYSYGYQDTGYVGASPQPDPTSEQQPGYAPDPAAYPQDPSGYGQDPAGYGQQQAYGADYGWQQQAPYPGDYGSQAEQHGYPPPPQQPPGEQQPQASSHQQADYGGTAGLDETSFFDTSMIDMERLRELDPGR